MDLFESKARFLGTLLLYGIVLSVILLYFRFPAEQLKSYCESELEQVVRGSDCTISGMRYSFPLAVVAKSIAFGEIQQKDQELFSLSNVRLSLNPAAIQSRFGLQLEAFGGTHSCVIDLNRAEKEFTLEDIEVNNLDPSAIPFLQRATSREITGTVEGGGTFHGVWKDKGYVMDGKGTISLSDGKFGLLLPILSLNSIDLKKFSTDVRYQNSILHCENGTFHGNEFDGEFSGTVALLSGLKRAGLSFKGDLEPLPFLLKKNKHAQKMVMQLQKQRKRGTVPFVLKGTVGKPRFKFES